MSAELEAAVTNLLAQWEYLRHVPSQALEAVRAAAQVPLSDALIARLPGWQDRTTNEAYGAAIVRRQEQQAKLLAHANGQRADYRAGDAAEPADHRGREH